MNLSTPTSSSASQDDDRRDEEFSDSRRPSDREIILLVDSYYSIEQSGYGEHSMPILHLCGRSEDGDRRHVRVSHFYPRFYISEQEFVNKRGSIERQLEKRSSSLLDYGLNHSLMDGRDVVDGVMLVCETPNDVKSLRDEFDRTWEADIQFPQVFKLAKDVNEYISVPRGRTEVHHDQIESADDSNTTIHERVCTFDIEVKSSEGFPDYENPSQEHTAITAHDSATDSYWSGVLRCQGWGSAEDIWQSTGDSNSESPCSRTEERLRDTDVDQLTIYNTEKELLYDFVQYLKEIQPDVLSGWNSNLFDIPYFINRCLRLNVGGLEDLSPTEDVDWISDAPRNTNYGLQGIVCLDGLEMYKAVTISQEKSYALDSIADKVLGVGKDHLESGIDNAWKNDPKQFLDYNVRDVEAVVEINEEKDMLTDFRGRRELTGARVDKCSFPKNLLNPAFLSHGRNYLEGQT